MTVLSETQPQQHSSDTLVFLGTYNNYAVLPHWPKGEESRDGLVVCRWSQQASGPRLEVLHKENVLNPAFMK